MPSNAVLFLTYELVAKRLRPTEPEVPALGK